RRPDQGGSRQGRQLADVRESTGSGTGLIGKRETGSGMRVALVQARLAASKDEVPIGAVVMRGDEIVAEAHNETVARSNPTYHAEFLAIERALDALETDRLTDCTL